MPRPVTRWLVTRTVEEEVDAADVVEAVSATRLVCPADGDGRDPVTTAIAITRIPTPEV